ncbi:MAG: PAS domain-containing protein, partial [Limisphaerales bacterium]
MDAQKKQPPEGSLPARAPLDPQPSPASQILDCIGHAVTVVDLDGRIIFWNKFSGSLYGWSAEEALGWPLLPLLVPDESQQAQLRAAMGLREEGKAWLGEVVLCRRDGTTFCALIANTPLFATGGEVIGRIMTAKDISERKAAEESMRESQAELRALANRLVTVREAEATRIARELHDQMGQALTAVQVDLAALLLDVEVPGNAAQKLQARIASISEVVHSALETATKICRELRPPVLDSLGLVPALE